MPFYVGLFPQQSQSFPVPYIIVYIVQLIHLAADINVPLFTFEKIQFIVTSLSPVPKTRFCTLDN